jgi:hypothetical protein
MALGFPWAFVFTLMAKITRRAGARGRGQSHDEPLTRAVRG